MSKGAFALRATSPLYFHTEKEIMCFLQKNNLPFMKCSKCLQMTATFDYVTNHQLNTVLAGFLICFDASKCGHVEKLSDKCMLMQKLS